MTRVLDTFLEEDAHVLKVEAWISQEDTSIKEDAHMLKAKAWIRREVSPSPDLI